MSGSADSDLLYEDAACGLLVTEADGTILRANRTFCAWLGRTPSDMVGRRFQSLLSVGAKIFHQTHWAPLLTMQGSLAEVKLEFRHADGRKIPMVLNAVVRKSDGLERHEIAAFSAHDRHRYEQELLSARQRTQAHLERELATQSALAAAQARLTLAIEAANLYKWSIDLASRERDYSPDAALLLGFAEPRALTSAEFVARMVDGDRTREQREVDAFLASGGSRFHTTFRLAGIDEVERWVACWALVHLDAEGSPTELVGVLQDISESRRQRAVAEDRALLAEQTLGIVGHDLRNPLSAILMAAELLALKTLDESQQRAVAKRLQSSTRRANRLIADLLDFTQARNGRGLRLNPASIDAHAVAREVVSELSSAHPTRRLRHAMEGDGTAYADADRLIQALGNLVSNALTYGQQDGEIVVTSAGNDLGVTFDVHNFGLPIDPALKPTLFEPMTRGETAGNIRSVGLGLYIVREIALAHGGSVSCVSEQAQGTTFTITLPRQAAAFV